MSTRILIGHCVHAADRPPLGRAEGYRDQVLAKLVEIGEIAQQTSADIMIFAGDLFDTKRPNFVSHFLVGQIQSILRGYPCDVWLLPGNHDLGTAVDMERFLWQPLSRLEGGNVHIATGMKVVSAEDTAVFFRPYSAEDDLNPDYYKLTPPELEISQKAPYVIVVAHGSVIPPGEQRPYPCVNFIEIDCTGIGLYYLGHLHEWLGVHLIDKTWFAGMGAISRKARTQANLTHEPRVLLIEKENELPPQMREIKLTKVLLAEEIFIEQVRAEEGTSDEITAFADALAEGLHTEQMPLDALLAGQDIDPAVKEKVKEYLVEAGL